MKKTHISFYVGPMAFCRTLFAGAFFAGGLVASGPALAQEDDDTLTFGALEVEVKSVERESYEAAVQKTKADQCDAALFDFWDLLQNEQAKEFHEGSEYYIAKCLYRMGLYHAALSRFTKILERGEKSKYFQTSREWLFFISRKLKDQGAVLDTIARYSTKGGVPENYADEFHYLLGKHYYLMGIGDLAPDPDEGRASEAEQMSKEQEEEEGGFDFGEGDLGGGGGDIGAELVVAQDFDFTDSDKPKKKKKKRTKRVKAKPKADTDDGGFDFGDTDGKPEKKAPKQAKKKKSKSYRAEGSLPPGEAMEMAIQHLDQVPEGAKYYAKARYLQGLVHFQREDFDRATDAMRHVVRLTHPKKGAYKSPKLREMAFFSLARTHYGFRQFRYALFYYDKVSRDSEAWLDALFESSWAYFRLGVYEKTLGNLITLHSPFFMDEYFPESLILKAVTYYENCRYPEARNILEDFENHYGGVRDELINITKESRTPEQYYELLEELSNKDASETNRLTLQIVKMALSDRGLKMLDTAVQEVDAELDRMNTSVPGLVSSELGDALTKALTDRRKQIVERAGTIMGDKLSAERDDLKSLSSQLFRIKFEIAKMEKEQIEAEMRGENMVVPLSAYRFSAAVDDEHEYYPFVGEYWRDELGTYEYTLTRGCRPESIE